MSGPRQPGCARDKIAGIAEDGPKLSVEDIVVATRVRGCRTEEVSKEEISPAIIQANGPVEGANVLRDVKAPKRGNRIEILAAFVRVNVMHSTQALQCVNVVG